MVHQGRKPAPFSNVTWCHLEKLFQGDATRIDLVKCILKRTFHFPKGLKAENWLVSKDCVFCSEGTRVTASYSLSQLGPLRKDPSIVILGLEKLAIVGIS